MENNIISDGGPEKLWSASGIYFHHHMHKVFEKVTITDIKENHFGKLWFLLTQKVTLLVLIHK